MRFLHLFTDLITLLCALQRSTQRQCESHVVGQYLLVCYDYESQRPFLLQYVLLLFAIPCALINSDTAHNEWCLSPIRYMHLGSSVPASKEKSDWILTFCTLFMFRLQVAKQHTLQLHTPNGSPATVRSNKKKLSHILPSVFHYVFPSHLSHHR